MSFQLAEERLEPFTVHYRGEDFHVATWDVFHRISEQLASAFKLGAVDSVMDACWASPGLAVSVMEELVREAPFAGPEGRDAPYQFACHAAAKAMGKRQQSAPFGHVSPAAFRADLFA